MKKIVVFGVLLVLGCGHKDALVPVSGEFKSKLQGTWSWPCHYGKTHRFVFWLTFTDKELIRGSETYLDDDCRNPEDRLVETAEYSSRNMLWDEIVDVDFQWKTMGWTFFTPEMVSMENDHGYLCGYKSFELGKEMVFTSCPNAFEQHVEYTSLQLKDDKLWVAFATDKHQGESPETRERSIAIDEPLVRQK